MKEIIDIIHKTIYQFFDVCGDDEETPMSDKDKLLLEVNKAICNNLKALEQEPCGKDINISTEDAIEPTRFEFDEEQEQLDFVQPHKKIPVTLTVGDVISRQVAHFHKLRKS